MTPSARKTHQAGSCNRSGNTPGNTETEAQAAAAGGTGHGAPGTAQQRLDSWLWCARFFKTRSRAAAWIAEGKLRITRNSETWRITKPAMPVRPGDLLTFPLGPSIRTICIAATAKRRGPAAEARQLYRDLGHF